MLKSMPRALVSVAFAVLLAAFGTLAHAQTQNYGAQTADALPDRATLYRMIQQLQQEVDSLRQQKAATPATSNRDDANRLQRKINTQQAQIDALASQLESRRTAASKTTIGGYGQFDYNNLNGKGGASDLDQIDLHRFVLFFGHQFNERWRLYSELEVEHVVASSEDAGEVEVEQAYVEYSVNNQLTARGGVILVPVGILNETHEPPTYYGVERNPVERFIVPTTYYVGGAGLTWRVNDAWTFDTLLHEGFNYDPTDPDKYAVDEGHQESSLAAAKNLALTSRIKYTGMPGLEWAASWEYQNDISQQSNDGAGSANLIETHVVWQRGQFGLRALAAYWDLQGDGPKAYGADKQYGWYIEPSWKFTPQWGVFARFNQWNNQAGSGTPGPLLDPGNTEKRETNLGVNWWPIPNVVLKADIQYQDNANGMEQNGFNLGLGYQF